MTTGRPPALAGQVVLVLGGSAGIGLQTALLARAEGADVVLTGRDPDRLKAAAEQVGAVRTAAFDATDRDALTAFRADLDGPLDHVLVTAGGPFYAPLDEIDLAAVGREFGDRIGLMIDLGRWARRALRPGGTLLFISGTGARRPTPGLTVISAVTAAVSAAAASLAGEIGPARINVIAAGFVDTPLSARLLGDGLDQRREDLRTHLPIGRVVQPADVAALAVHLMVNTAVTGATYDVDGGQGIVPQF